MLAKITPLSDLGVAIMPYIDEMKIDAVKTLPAGSILVIRSDTSKLSHIPEGVIVKLSDSPPNVLRALPPYLSEIRVSCSTPVNTIGSIPEDKIVSVDSWLLPKQIAAIKSKTILLFKELDQKDIDNLISNLTIKEIIFSLSTPQNVVAKLIDQIRQGLKEHHKTKGARDLVIKNPLEPEIVSVANVRPVISAEDDRGRLVEQNKALAAQNALLQLQLNAAQQVASRLTQQPPQAAVSKLYPGRSIGQINKRWAMDGLREENERLKKALTQATLEKNLAEAEVRRYSEAIFEGSAISVLSTLLRPNLALPEAPQPDAETESSPRLGS